MHFPLTFILFCLYLQFSNIVVRVAGKIPTGAAKTIGRFVTEITGAKTSSIASKGMLSNMRQPGISHARMPQKMDVPQLERSAALARPQHLKSVFTNTVFANTGKSHVSAQNSPLILSSFIPKNHNSIPNMVAKLNLRNIHDEGKSDHSLLKNLLEVGKSVVNQVIAEYKSFNGIFGEEQQKVAQRSYSAIHSPGILFTRSNLAAEFALSNKFIEKIDKETMDEIRKKATIVFKMEMKILELLLQWDGDAEAYILPEFLPKKLAKNAGIEIAVGNKMTWVEMKEQIKNIQQIAKKYIKELEEMEKEEKEALMKKIRNTLNHDMEWVDMKILIEHIQEEGQEKYIKVLEKMLEEEEEEEMKEKIRNILYQIEMLRMRLEMAEMAKVVSETANEKEMREHIEMFKNWRNREENKAYFTDFTDNTISNEEEEEISRKNTH